MTGIKITDSIKDTDFLSPQEKIESCFHDEHINFLTDEVDNNSIKSIIQWIIFENSSEEDFDKTLTLYINSPGGDLYEAFALIDIMNASKYPIRTIGIGQVMSAAFLIFCSGTKGQRFIGRNSGIMCHQLSDNFGGKHHDLKATMKEVENCNRRMIAILKRCSGMDDRNINSKLLNSTDVYLKAEDMLNYGLADQIL